MDSKGFLWLSVGYTAVITIFFLYPFSGPAHPLFDNADKVVHAILHSVLSCLWLLFIFYKTQAVIRFYIVLVLFYCLFYGIIIELIQFQFTTTREADIFDVVANFAGSLLGLTLFFAITGRKKF